MFCQINNKLQFCSVPHHHWCQMEVTQNFYSSIDPGMPLRTILFLFLYWARELWLVSDCNISFSIFLHLKRSFYFFSGQFFITVSLRFNTSFRLLILLIILSYHFGDATWVMVEFRNLFSRITTMKYFITPFTQKPWKVIFSITQ